MSCRPGPQSARRVYGRYRKRVLLSAGIPDPPLRPLTCLPEEQNLRGGGGVDPWCLDPFPYMPGPPSVTMEPLQARLRPVAVPHSRQDPRLSVYVEDPPGPQQTVHTGQRFLSRSARTPRTAFGDDIGGRAGRAGIDLGALGCSRSDRMISLTMYRSSWMGVHAWKITPSRGCGGALNRARWPVPRAHEVSAQGAVPAAHRRRPPSAGCQK